MDADGLLRGGDGLNSSRNFDCFVFATLLLRASGMGFSSSGFFVDVLAAACEFVMLYRLAGIGVSSLSVGG